MLVDRNGRKLEQVKESLGKSTGSVGVIEADVSKGQDTQRYIDQAAARWGRIDVLFSHAGISGAIAPITEYPEEVFDEEAAPRGIRVNILAPGTGSFGSISCFRGEPLFDRQRLYGRRRDEHLTVNDSEKPASQTTGTDRMEPLYPAGSWFWGVKGETVRGRK